MLYLLDSISPLSVFQVLPHLPSGKLQAYANGGIELWGDCSNYVPAFPVWAWRGSNRHCKNIRLTEATVDGDNTEINKRHTKKSADVLSNCQLLSLNKPEKPKY